MSKQVQLEEINNINQTSVKTFLARKNISTTVKTYLVDVLGAMTFGLFASLPIGAIFTALEGKTNIALLVTIADYTKGTTGATLGVSIVYILKAPQLVPFSAATIGIAGNVLGDPVGVLVATIVGMEFSKTVSKETHVDILITPGVTIISGVSIAQSVDPSASTFTAASESLVRSATEMQPFFIEILVSILTGVVLTLPISSVAICIVLSLDGLAGGATTTGCCVQMVGFAVLSFRENDVGSLLVQGLGTSTLQMDNTVKNPRIWIPPTLASMITGPVVTMVFKLQNIPASSDMGTCGLVGPIGVYTAMGGGTSMWIGILLVCFVLPAVLTYGLGIVLRRMG